MAWPVLSYVAMKNLNHQSLANLLYEALETERGGIKVYSTALECALNDDLKQEWQKYLEQTRNHEAVLLGVFEVFGLDPEADVPARKPVVHSGKSLVEMMRIAQQGADPAAAELVACECVSLAETKDHLNWELLSHVAKKLTGDQGKALRAACEEVEDEEDEHLYHTKGWCRELHIKALGMPAVLPPPEEKKDVKTAIGAARAEKQRGNMLKGVRSH